MKKMSVLLVEDNADHEYLALKVIQDLNATNQTMIVRDGQEALDYLYYEGSFAKRPIALPQFILLDLKLPKVSGLDILKKIRSTDSTKNIPVVILTSSKSNNDIKTCYGEGANCYITKPLTTDKLTQAIYQFLEYMANQNNTVE
jgi:CheY-like chemotaxis protein